jgi:uncharacterized membrane protein
MIVALSDIAKIGLYLLYIFLPILALYIAYLILTKAFKYMGFSSIEAIIIVFLSFILGAGLIDDYVGFSFSNIFLFSSGNWNVGINTGGAIIPIILSIYMIIRNKIKLQKVLIGTIVVSVVTYFVTYVKPESGIVSPYPLFLLPAVFASFASVFLLWKNFRKAAPLAYISGTLGVLIGADVFHLQELLSYTIDKPTSAVIGGADVFDMIYITGILAVILDGIIMYKQKTKEGL